MAKKQNVDMGRDVVDTMRAFGARLLDHFIQLVVVAVSATQTSYLVSIIAPQWAAWLASFAVLLMEGGYLFWMWREFEADMADGDLSDKEKNAQERIANRMVYITLGLSALTSLAGGFLEVANSDLAMLLTQFPALASYLAIAAISGIFILGVIHLFADWHYRRSDPDIALDRVHRANVRRLARDRQQAVYDGEELVTGEQVQHTRRLYTDNKTRLGQAQAKDEFEQRYQYASDIDANPTKPPR